MSEPINLDNYINKPLETEEELKNMRINHINNLYKDNKLNLDILKKYDYLFKKNYY